MARTSCMDKNSVQAVVQVGVLLVGAHDRVQLQSRLESDMTIDLLACKCEPLQVYAQNLGRVVDSHLFSGINQHLAPVMSDKMKAEKGNINNLEQQSCRRNRKRYIHVFPEYVLVAFVLVSFRQDFSLGIVAERPLHTFSTTDIQTDVQVSFKRIGFVTALHALDLTLKVASKNLMNDGRLLNPVVQFAVK